MFTKHVILSSKVEPNLLQDMTFDKCPSFLKSGSNMLARNICFIAVAPSL